MTDVAHRLTAALSDRYRIEREIGAGGIATVYLAHDLRHQRDVAIKVLHPDLGAALGSIEMRSPSPLRRSIDSIEPLGLSTLVPSPTAAACTNQRACTRRWAGAIVATMSAARAAYWPSILLRVMLRKERATRQ